MIGPAAHSCSLTVELRYLKKLPGNGMIQVYKFDKASSKNGQKTHQPPLFMSLKWRSWNNGTGRRARDEDPLTLKKIANSLVKPPRKNGGFGVMSIASLNILRHSKNLPPFKKPPRFSPFFQAKFNQCPKSRTCIFVVVVGDPRLTAFSFAHSRSLRKYLKILTGLIFFREAHLL